jgi:hypothetical protein
MERVQLEGLDEPDDVVDVRLIPELRRIVGVVGQSATNSIDGKHPEFFTEILERLGPGVRAA